MIRSFANAATLLSAVVLLAGCEETKSSAGDAEATKAVASSSAVAAATVVAPTATVTASAAATPAATDAGVVEPKDAGHDAAKPKK